MRMQIDPTLVSRLRSSLNEDAAVGLLRRLVRTPSVTGNEAAFARLLADELTSLGADEVTLVDFAPGRPNVRGLFRGQRTGSRPCLLITGHTDTVNVRGWSEHWAATEREDPFSAAIVDGAVWGRGAGDLKAGIAAALTAAKLLAAAGLKPSADLLFAFVASLQTRLANDLPLVVGDRIQFQQVILNLVLNAIQAMSGTTEGPREMQVSSEKVSAKHSGYKPENQERSSLANVEWSHVLITVRDSGPGLDTQLVNRLFEAFYTTKPQGLGIGLTISRSIIEAHGGKLWAKANTPPGATFQFTYQLRDNSCRRRVGRSAPVTFAID